MKKSLKILVSLIAILTFILNITMNETGGISLVSLANAGNVPPTETETEAAGWAETSVACYDVNGKYVNTTTACAKGTNADCTPGPICGETKAPE